MNNGKIILDLCGGTGAWSKYYRENGYQVMIISLPQWDLTNEKVVKYLCSLNVYGILFATPCTVWANSGVRWFDFRKPRELFKAFQIFFKGYRVIMYHMLKGNLHFYSIENPIGMMRHLLGEPQLIFNPSDYGDTYTKKTLLWGKFNIPERNPVPATQGSKMHTKYGGKSERTKELRSITPDGFAQAFYKANR